MASVPRAGHSGIKGWSLWVWGLSRPVKRQSSHIKEGPSTRQVRHMETRRPRRSRSQGKPAPCSLPSPLEGCRKQQQGRAFFSHVFRPSHQRKEERKKKRTAGKWKDECWGSLGDHREERAVTQRRWRGRQRAAQGGNTQPLIIAIKSLMAF